MKKYLDTSVWIASFLHSHPKHQFCLELINKSLEEENTVLLSSTHCLAELYSVLTKMPVPYKFQPQQALSIIKETILTHVKVVSLNSKEYILIINQAAKLNIISGGIFDGLHVQAAIKSKADEIITLNYKDFSRFEIPKTMKLVDL